jgi:hypothetical protein
VPVFSESEPVYAFVTVKYKSGIFLSSAVNSVIPHALGVEPEKLAFKRLVYDSDMGLSDWLILDKNTADLKLKMESGPFGLQGVTSSAHRLATFRLADPQYKGKPESSLQLTLYSPVRQTVDISVASSQNLARYGAVKELFPDDNWTKLTVGVKDFKSADGVLGSWSDVLSFEIESGATVLVNSLLWV